MTSTIHNTQMLESSSNTFFKSKRFKDNHYDNYNYGSGSNNKEPKITKPRTMATDPTETKPMREREREREREYISLISLT